MIRCCYCVIVLFCLGTIGTGCWVSSPTSGLSSYQANISTGSFGRYKLDTPDAVRDFNLQVKKWFTDRSFTNIENVAYSDLVNSESWNKPGTLLLLKQNHQRLVYVFIPDCYHPEDNIQIIGYHVDWKGTTDEVNESENDFNQLKSDFLKEFPSNHSLLEN